MGRSCAPLRWLVSAMMAVLLVSRAEAAETNVESLARVLRLDQVIAVIHQEGLVFGADLDREFLNGRGGVYWARAVADIFDEGRLADEVHMAMGAGMTAQQMAACRTFFESDRGQRILSLETSARRAMIEPEVEAAAREAHEALKGSDDRLLADVTRFVEVNDLIDRNVTGAMKSGVAFWSGLADGGGGRFSDAQILAEVWAQESQTRAETESWIYAFLLLAYKALPPGDLEEYIAFSRTDAGQALNEALFQGFETGQVGSSRALGIRAAGVLDASDL